MGRELFAGCGLWVGGEVAAYIRWYNMIWVSSSFCMSRNTWVRKGNQAACSQSNHTSHQDADEYRITKQAVNNLTTPPTITQMGQFIFFLCLGTHG